MSRPPRDLKREVELLRRARDSLAELQDYYELVQLRSPARTTRKAISLLAFIREISQ